LFSFEDEILLHPVIEELTATHGGDSTPAQSLSETSLLAPMKHIQISIHDRANTSDEVTQSDRAIKYFQLIFHPKIIFSQEILRGVYEGPLPLAI
jgi:hypothetical protein